MPISRQLPTRLNFPKASPRVYSNPTLANTD